MAGWVGLEPTNFRFWNTLRCLGEVSSVAARRPSETQTLCAVACLVAEVLPPCCHLAPPVHHPRVPVGSVRSGRSQRPTVRQRCLSSRSSASFRGRSSTKSSSPSSLPRRRAGPACRARRGRIRFGASQPPPTETERERLTAIGASATPTAARILSSCRRSQKRSSNFRALGSRLLRLLSETPRHVEDSRRDPRSPDFDGVETSSGPRPRDAEHPVGDHREIYREIQRAASTPG